MTLIQGPPGTGKTTTVLGTLSVLLSAENSSQQQVTQKKKEVAPKVKRMTKDEKQA